MNSSNTTNHYLERLENIICKKSLSLKNLTEADRFLVLSCAALTLDSQQTYSEVEVSIHLQRWLNDAGEMLCIDSIELRRTLIDRGLWTRNKTGQEYYLTALSVEHPAYDMLSILQSCALMDLITVWKQQHAEKRLQRSQRFQQLTKS